jgi:heparan-alpha-glucosaminide N-acetyltransferase
LLDSTRPPAAKPRIVSLDIFRGLNIALMIFVNELAELQGLPWWTHHAPAQVNVMTYVDMVFPGFLLIVGMSLPLAMRARIQRGDSTLKLIWYIVLRSAALIVLGIILANGAEGNEALMHGLSAAVWTLLAIFAAFLVWLDYPKTEDARRRSLYLALRFVGILMLVGLAIVYRRTDPATRVTSWLNFVYPEILGLIGYTYLVVGFCYLATRRWLWAPLAWFFIFITLNILSAAKIVNTVHPWWWWPPQNGSQPALVFAGIVLTTLFFLEPRCNTFLRKAVPAILFGVITAVAAYLLSPLGISKIRATPTWVLYTIAACCVIYPALYYLCDIRKQAAWAAPVKAAGSNTLLTYLLPDVWYYLIAAFNVEWFVTHLNYGTAAVLRAIVFTALMLGIATLLTRYRLRLQI